jgi:hypothetical protein
MAYISDDSGDHAFVDGVETVSYDPAEAGISAIAGVKAIRGTVDTIAPTFSDGLALTPDDVVFCIWTVTLGGRVIRRDDTITDTAATPRSYQVRSWRDSEDENQVICVCRKLA